MTNQHPITPPPELMRQWIDDDDFPFTTGAFDLVSISKDRLRSIATQAARWGADQELEACCEWLGSEINQGWGLSGQLRTARRPKTLSLKEQALQALYRFDDTEGHKGLTPDDIADDFDLIRRALEQLDV